jgi:D-alanyl-D-alanine carboxypeptidase
MNMPKGSEIQNALDSRAGEIGAFGIGVGVARVGSTATFASWGVDGRNPDVPMTPTGRFRIGSVTKTFTSALVLDLVEQAELTLDETIEQWFPAYPHAAQMSVRSLLTHTSGTADMTFDAFPDLIGLLLSDLTRAFRPEEVIELAAALPPHAAPGESYRYSNTDYLLLGHIVECVSGHAFAELVSRRFTAPLGLDATAYEDDIPDDLKHGWFDLESIGTTDGTPQRDQDANSFPNTALITTAYAAGGMTSSLADLLMWGEALYLGRALSASTRDQLLASPSVEDPVAGDWHGFGVVAYGSRLPDGTWPAYGHAGNIVGSSAFVASFPRSHTTVAIHANIQEVSTEALIELAFDLEQGATSDE